jgi:hypothetical protein
MKKSEIITDMILFRKNCYYQIVKNRIQIITPTHVVHIPEGINVDIKTGITYRTNEIYYTWFNLRR